ncbi:hypothetical protein HZH68_015862 [Vespula germanica]|uniref:N-acetyltransferase domain-containing protein n=1 Tax=Vespula germanica TaxID=30212 RepID=A0A834MQ00_VESGE|nr:hypothetical protein HZH68_015862 [Vespula germanica]
MSNGYRIISLEEDRFKEAINFIRKDFFVEEPISTAIDLLDDFMSVRTSINMIQKKLSEMQSYCAVQEGENKIIGVIVASINFMGDHVRKETRIKENQGEAIFNIMSLRSCVFSKARPYEILQIDKYFRIHLLLVHMNHRKKGIGTALIKCCIERARTLLVPACIAGFSSVISQHMARKLGFNLLAEVMYKDFKVFNDEMQCFEYPFEDSIDQNKSLACMALSIALPIDHSQRSASIISKKENTNEKKNRKKSKRK